MDSPGTQEFLSSLADDLRSGRPVDDSRFDRLLATRWRFASPTHWTPVDVCRRAMALLAPRAGESVLDVGSGVGKVCLIGALTTPATFVGVEQRPHLVEQAHQMAQLLGAERVLFVCRSAFALDWRPYQCLYLYNPFGELHFEPSRRLDASVTAGGDVYRDQVAATQRRLASMPAGTRVVTYHGLGGPLPDGYAAVAVETIAGGTLACWVKEH